MLPGYGQTHGDLGLYSICHGAFAALVGQTVQKLERKQTNGQTDGRTDATKRIISLASRLINMHCHSSRLFSYNPSVGQITFMLRTKFYFLL